MPTSHDPFPMSSPEARTLAASMENSTASQWEFISTTHDHLSEESTRNVNDEEQQEYLMGRRNSNKKLNTDIPRTSSHNNTLYTRLYGDKLPMSEMIRTLTLAMTLFFMIGGLWIFRSLKDPILTSLCGVTAIPKAKMLSVIVVLVVVTIYNRLLDTQLPRHVLFYVIGTFYGVVFTIIALLLMHPTIGLANQQPHSTRILGWVTYCSAESYGSVMVSLFWSFANSNFSLETAKASYGVMVALAQLGSILGPTIVHRYVGVIGVPACFLLGAACTVLLQCTMYIYIHNYGVQEQTNSQKKTPKAGVLEGLKLFWDHNYVKGIFAMSTLFMIIGTIIDYTMKLLARDHFAALHPCEVAMSCYNPDAMGMSKDATAAFTKFMGLFGLATNTLSFTTSLLCTSAIIRHLGLRSTLLLFPSLCLILILTVRMTPTLNVCFYAMMLLKAGIYALNNTTKELLYQPTSSSIRYKAKSWIDIFGARSAKALGSVVTNAWSHSFVQLVATGSMVGVSVALVLLCNAIYMGKSFDEYTTSGHVVGDEHDPINIRISLTNIAENDTSCAISNDDEESN